MYLISRLNDDGADGHLHIVLQPDQHYIDTKSNKASYVNGQKWLHEMTLIVFIHECVNSYILDYQFVPAPTTAPFVGYINTSSRLKTILSCYAKPGFLEIITVRNSTVASMAMSTSMSWQSLFSSPDASSHFVKWRHSSIRGTLDKIRRKKIQFLDEDAKAEVQSMLFSLLWGSEVC